ncbi:MAG: sugar phosphate isomerase/epimerase family protein [Chloroflexota bacterium]
MLLGLDTNSYHLATGLYEYQPQSLIGLHEMIDRAADLDLAGLHIANMRLLASGDDVYLADLRARAEDHGLYIELGSEGTDASQLRSAVGVALKLGSRIVRTFVGADRQGGWAVWRQQLDRAVEGLKQVVPFARDVGVTIALENHGDLTSPELVNLLDKVASDGEGVGVCLDTGKSLLVVEDPLVATQNLAPYVVTACLTDYRLLATARGARIIGCSLGQGAVDLLSIVQILRQRRPDLHLNIESPVQAWEMPFLEDKFWDAFYDRGPRDLAAIIRLIRKNALDPTADYRTPVEKGLPEGEVLAYEEDMLVRSVVYAKQVLLGGS